MASRVFNKFKEPKSTEFSKKDLVIDVKGGHLYYKSNLGVHKLVGDTIGTSIIESGDVWVDFGSYISYTPNTLTSPVIQIGTNLTPSTQGGFPEVIIDGQLAIRNTDARIELDDTTGDKFRIQNQNGRFKIIQHNESISDNDILAISGSRVGIGDETPSYKFEILEDRKSNYMVRFTNNSSDSSEWGYGIIIDIDMAGSGAGLEDTTSFMSFRQNGSQVGSITHELGVATHYNTSSDKRLKTNIIPTKYSLNDLLKIEIVDYEFKNSLGKQTTGIIAQQAKEIYPEFIYAPENKNLKEGDKEYEYMQADYGKLTPLLVKSIQDLYKIVQEQERKIKQLENGG